jgi:hypothetical protein
VGTEGQERLRKSGGPRGPSGGIPVNQAGIVSHGAAQRELEKSTQTPRFTRSAKTGLLDSARFSKIRTPIATASGFWNLPGPTS